MANTYQWQRCNSDGTGCVDISGATNSTYTLTTGDVGKRIRCKGTKDGITATVSALSDVIGSTPPTPPAPGGSPYVSIPDPTLPSGTTVDATTSTIDSVVAGAAAGTIVRLRAGTYTGGDLNIYTGIVLTAYPGETPIVSRRPRR